ncbi:hypothetical protein AcV5_002548 [Taiwanofungus camphoratus]|nr:hypothetical protein AcV5_002548 [Antrodia cinnamomea]
MCADNQSLREDDTLVDMVPSIDAISTRTADLKSEPDRPAKRPRLEPSPSPSSAATASCTRHPQFWHADGSVVLQVSQTLFRLHASQLKKQSTFFADLLKEDGNSQPAAAVDGCPLYRIANVSVQDMERLLGALGNGLTYTIKPPPSEVLISILRAAHTLCVPSATAFAALKLRKQWPGDIDRLSAASKDIYKAVEMVNVGQNYALPEVLKRAYYELLRSQKFWQEVTTNRKRICLSDADIIRLFEARDKLQSEWICTALRPPDPAELPCPLERPSSASNSYKRCRNAWSEDGTQWSTCIIGSNIFEDWRHDPLHGLDCIITVGWDKMGFCQGCLRARQKLWQGKKDQWWKDLDAWLKLDVAGKT